MLNYVMTTFIEITLSTSVIIALFWMLRPLVGKKYVAKWRYWLWLLLAFRLLLPVNISLPEAPIQITAPTGNLINNIPVISQGTVYSTADHSKIVEKDTSKQTISVQHVAMMIWLFGTVVVLAYQLIGHYLFLKTLKRWSKPVSDQRILELFGQTLKQMEIHKKIMLKTSKKATSPMLTGVLRPTVWLPPYSYRDDELRVIFKHELVHYKQHHLWYKLIMLCAQSVHWFNPLVHLMVKEAGKDMEVVCDSEVVKGTSMVFRKQYSEIILSMVTRHPVGKTTLSTHFNGGKKMIRQRIIGIFDTKKKGRGIGAILLVGLLLALAGGIVACGTDTYSSGSATIPAESSPVNTNGPVESTLNPSMAAGTQETPESGNNPSPAEGENFLNTPEGQAFEKTAKAFAQAFFRGDQNTMKEHLLTPESDEHSFPKNNLANNVESMTLKWNPEQIKETTISAQYEIRLKGADTYQYLDLQLEKTGQEWKVKTFGLEQ